MRVAAATLVPLMVLGVLELGLRIAGYVYPTPFFLNSKIEGRDFLIPNYQFSYRFFPPALARVPVLFRMAAQKPVGTYRIFLFGESAAFGDPDPSYGVGRYLEVLLEERYPGTDFEVICVAMTAINSHAVLPIARECARLQGDLWIVYMGNNEMVGPYGAGTVFGAKAPPPVLVHAMLALKTTRVGQLLDALITGLQSSSAIPQAWTGIDMFSKNQLRHDNAARLRAYENFRENLEEILRAGEQAGVPVLLSTVASNLKDCAPFASLHRADLDTTQLQEWTAWYEQGVGLETAGSYEAALNAYTKAAALDSDFAELQFRLAKCQLALNQTDLARQSFERARDYDVLAVRADTRINQILTDMAVLPSGGRVIPVDAAQALASRAPAGIPGREQFFEHVHFTLAGNYALARIFADQVAEVLPASITATGAESWVEAESCDRRLGVTLWDQKRLWTEVLGRISVPPFTSQSSHRATRQYCEARSQEVVAQINTETPARDRQIYEEALARAPEDNLLRGNYAQFLEVTSARSQAITEGQRICQMLPDLAWPYYYVGALLVREGRVNEAAQYFERALKIRSDFMQARQQLERIRAGYPRGAGGEVTSER